MQTVILAAGAGTRMRPLTDTVPKPVLPVADRPLVGHVASAAVAAGASHLIVVVSGNDDAVREYFGDQYRDVPVTVAEQTSQEGTADALQAARHELRDAPLVVLNGDIVIDAGGLAQLYEQVPAVGAARVDDPASYGVLDTTEDGTVTGVLEKPESPPSNLVNAGAYTFPADALDALDAIERSDRGEFELTDLLETVCRQGTVSSVAFERWLDVGRPWELLTATQWRLEDLDPVVDGEVHPDAHLDDPVVVEEGASIRPGVVIEGPTLVRSGATIGPNAYLRGATVIGPDAHVGHAVEVKNSVLFAGATVGHQSYVGDSILGPAVNIGAGTNVANLRHDEQAVRTTVDGEAVSSGRRKYGVVLGPHVKTGINTSLNAGVVLDTEATTTPGEVVLKSRG